MSSLISFFYFYLRAFHCGILSPPYLGLFLGIVIVNEVSPYFFLEKFVIGIQKRLVTLDF